MKTNKQQCRISITFYGILLILTMFVNNSFAANMEEIKLTDHITISIESKTDVSIFLDGAVYEKLHVNCKAQKYSNLDVNGNGTDKKSPMYYLDFSTADPDELIVLNYICKLK